METTPILELFSPMVLIAIGIALIALEALFFSFIFFWFGVAFLLVGLSSYFIGYGDGLWQLSAVSVISLLLLVSLRTKALATFMKPRSHEHNDDFLNEAGEGEIRNSKVYFKGTYWKIVSNEKFEEGEKVKVTQTEGSSAHIEKCGTGGRT